MRCVKVKYIKKFTNMSNFDSKINLQQYASFYSLRIHFTFKIPSFHMDLLTSDMSMSIYKVIYQYFNH
jgi:hypothetical protein